IPTVAFDSAAPSSTTAPLIAIVGSNTPNNTTSNTPHANREGDFAIWPSGWGARQAIASNFAPVIAARGATLVLGALYSQLALHEPVRQLVSASGISGGALAGSSGSWFGAAAVVTQLGSAFAGGASFVDTTYCQSGPGSGGDLNPCVPRVSVNRWVLDVLVVVCVVQLGALAGAVAKWFQKPGGLAADPTTIAGVAVVMGHPEVERLFAALPGDASHQELKAALRGRRFRLGAFVTEAGVEKYGIMPVPEEELPKKKKGGPWVSVGERLAGVRERLALFESWQHSRLFVDMLFAALLLALLGLALAALASVDNPQSVFFAAELSAGGPGGTAMKILFALLGVAVSAYWGRLFQDTQTFTPYFPLREGEARPAPTILLNRHTSPLCALLPLARNGHVAAASVAFTGLVAEFLIICLSGLPYRPGQLRSEFVFCGAASAGILCLMLAQLALVMLWRRRLPHLPRRPDSIAAVMTYVAGTAMVRDFCGLESLTTRQRNKAIRDMGKVYAYGWRREAGEDGRAIVRWVVDEVPGQ
ncbi:hypothetical protein B0T24DRAFT_709096, partial [Lasiosphaeria ovina]